MNADEFFSFHTNQFDEMSQSWDACLRGCEISRSLEEQTGDAPIQTLKNCNYSCDKSYIGAHSQACKSGCGYNYDMASTEMPLSPRIESVSAPSPQPSFVSINLPGLFHQINRVMPKLNQIVERTFSNPFERESEFSLPALSSMPSFDSLPSIPRLPGGFFGRKDSDEVEPLFDDFLGAINSQMNNMFQALPKMDNLNSWSPFPFGKSRGKITVIKAGPGFMEEKHYDIDPEGNVHEVNEPVMRNDALEHVNPLDSNMNESDVEVFSVPTEVEIIPQEKEDFGSVHVEPVEEPVDDTPEQAEVAEIPRTVEEKEEAKEPQPLIRARPIFELENMDPFLSVLRNSIQEGDRMKEQIFNNYRAWKNAEYKDNNSCSSDHLRWSDWVACVHVKMGVPRWLTAATIALGIIFSVWLCLIIPTSAPKQRIRSLVIKTEKLSLPSTMTGKEKMSAAEAKEAEANGRNEAVVAVIKVDLPPHYTEVTPGSPAPSYKSDMVPPIPGSPAPSYKSVDTSVKPEEPKIEPVHGRESTA